MNREKVYLDQAWKKRKGFYELCGKIQLKRKLSVHHKDNNYKNNEDKNLQTLCDKCHKTLHWRELGIIGNKQKIKAKENRERKIKALILILNNYNNPNLIVDGRIQQRTWGL